MEIIVQNEKLNFVIEINEEQRARLVWFSPFEWNREQFVEQDYYSTIELHCLGCDIDDHHGMRHTKTLPSRDLKYVSHKIEDEETGKLLTLVLSDDEIKVTQLFRFYSDSSTVRCQNIIKNVGTEPKTLLYATSFCYYGICTAEEKDWQEGMEVYIPHNTWHGEMQWRKNTYGELGISQITRSTLKRLAISNVGAWSTGEYLPIGVIHNKQNDTSLFWQIEHNGSWYWESSFTKESGPYIQLGGPNFESHHFSKTLETNEEFITVPVSVGACDGDFEEAMRCLTKYRRAIRRPSEDNEKLPVIFNDYMNCLMGDPSEEKELPMIDAAADMGCEYYVIDAGWFYDGLGGDDDWWTSLGEYSVSKRRFPNGLKYISDYIRKKGMKPGIWLELESMGCDSEAADRFPDEFFFQHGGKRVMQHNRYQLDFRNPKVRKRADEIVDTVVKEHGFDYIKLDYNINSGLGTDYNCESLGLGLLEYSRAFLDWLKSTLDRYPQLVIENCASGGQRMDYASLSQLSLQSTSDQTDYRLTAAIASMASSALTPEQGAVWSYPSLEGDEEETAFNMVNAMLGRVHQSGFLHSLKTGSKQLIKDGINCYKQIRNDIKEALPLYPLGLISLRSPWAVAALQTDKVVYVSVWRCSSEDNTLEIPLPKSKNSYAECMYPTSLPVEYNWDGEKGTLRVKLEKQYTARFFKIVY